MQGDFVVGSWLVQPSLCRISRGSESRRLRAKVMDLLVYFASRPNRVVSKQDLLNDVWQTDAISESALTRSITELRQALGDSAQTPEILETIAKRGYRLIAPVSAAAAEGTVERAADAPRSPLRRYRWTWTGIAVVTALAVAGSVVRLSPADARRVAGPGGSSWGDHATTRSRLALEDYILAAQLMRAEGARGLDAKPHLLKALREDPEFASAHLLLAYALQCTGATPAEYLPPARKALALSARVTEQERHFIAASLSWLLAQAATDADARRRYLTSAIPEFEQTLRLQPDHLWANWLLSTAYDATNRQEDSTRGFQRLAALRPDSFPLQAYAAGATLRAFGTETARPLFQRAARLLDRGADEGAAHLRQFVEFFPVHDAWLHGRADEAARLASAHADRYGTRYDDQSWMRLGEVRLALGQLRLAEDAFSQMQASDMRAIGFAGVALARGDTDSVLSHVTSCRTLDLIIVSFALRAGDFGRARQLFAAIPAPADHRRWSDEEIREASGDSDVVTRALPLGAPWTRVIRGARAFLYSETLAAAAARDGKVEPAIRVLREAQPLDQSALTAYGHTGYFWVRTQMLMADLYRRANRVSDARDIERRLQEMLAAADDDFLGRPALDAR